jgi:capsular polysaccharide biosynthesis protein
VVTSTNPVEAEQIANCLAEKGIEYIPEVMETSEPNMAEQAVVPTVKSSPNITKNAIMGGMLAAVLCMAVLVIRFLLDDTIKDAEDVEKFLGTMPLSVIPEGFANTTDDKKKNGRKGKENE